MLVPAYYFVKISHDFRSFFVIRYNLHNEAVITVHSVTCNMLFSHCSILAKTCKKVYNERVSVSFNQNNFIYNKGVNIESGPQRHLPDNHITCSAGIVSLFLI